MLSRCSVCIVRRPMRRETEPITAQLHHLSPTETSAEEGGGKRESVGSDEEELVMVIRLAAVEGDQFSSNSGEVHQHKLETGGGVQHQLYDGNPGPTDLSTAANIQ